MKAVRAKKFLGQHFLINEGIAKKITDLISKKNNKNVLEIGFGIGTDAIQFLKTLLELLK